MSREYISMLLAKLSSTADEDDMTELLDEIKGTGDPVFLYPLYQAYKNNKINYISHYFIATMGNLNSSDVVSIAFEIGENPEICVADRIYVLDIFDREKVYEKRAIAIALSTLSTFIQEKPSNEYELYSIISYLKNANFLNHIEDDLLAIFVDKGFNTKSRKYAFGKWLEVNPEKNLQNIIDKFHDIKENKDQEILIAKVISGWSGSKSEILKQRIEIDGSVQAKCITKESREKDKKKEQKNETAKKEVVKKNYSNADLVEKISILREKINDVARQNKNIGFSIFPQNETICLQLKSANDDATLIKACSTLREIIQNLSKDLGNHGLTTEKVKILLPDTAQDDFNKSINKLFLYLSSKKIKVDNSVFGLKLLNQIVGLIASHSKNERQKLIKKLKEVKLDKIYLDEEWDILHRSLLEKYIDSLTELLKAIVLLGK